MFQDFSFEFVKWNAKNLYLIDLLSRIEVKFATGPIKSNHAVRASFSNSNSNDSIVSVMAS